MGCKPQSTIAPVAEPELPKALSQSYKTSFRNIAEATALRFLKAYDGFAETGPVTTARVLAHAKVQASLERGKLLTYVLAIDMNGDTKITRTEYEEFSKLPKWSSQLLRMDDLFQSDEDQDGVISLQEAVLYSRKLSARSSAHDMRPIESYFMLFDINQDGVVRRAEIQMSLAQFRPKKTAEASILR